LSTNNLITRIRYNLSFNNEHGTTLFNYRIFEQPNKFSFDKNNLSKASFAGSDITRIRFGDKVSWGEKGFTIVEEEWLTEQEEEEDRRQMMFLKAYIMKLDN
jgi:hypothetical protein